MSAAPACSAECTAVLRKELARACRSAGVPVVDAHITHIAPLVPTLYEDLRMRCPHGVLWHVQPTSEQMARWVEDDVA